MSRGLVRRRSAWRIVTGHPVGDRRFDETASAERREATLRDAVDVAEQLGEHAVVDGGDGGAQDDLAEDVGALYEALAKDCEAGEGFDERAHQRAPVA